MFPRARSATARARCLLLVAAVAAGPAGAALLVREPDPGVAMSRNTPVEGWLPMPMDHFHASNLDTWDMRYYYNPEFAPLTNASHVLILVGGEWSISPGWLTTGLMYEMASELGAAMFYTEHRYYGQSRPTDDTSTENLRYLNVDQALGDLAVFIAQLKQFEGGRYAAANVGLVGCSYAGSMVTWMRLGYPHLVDAGFSVSGPLQAQEDFPEYLEVITSALRTQGSEECVAAVQESMEALVELLETADGPARVSELFNVCSTLNPLEPLDLASFFWYGVTETFAYLVQYAVPGEIPAACAALTDASITDPVQRLASWVTSERGGACIESRYTEIVAAHTNTSFDSYDSVMRLWTYQTCVEYGWYQTTSSSAQPFLGTVPLEYFHRQCQDFFGDYFNVDTLRAGIKRTNVLFGGLSFLPDHVVSVGGGDDPWSPMGPVTSDVALAPVYVVPATSHCRAMRSVADSESVEMAWAKNMTKVHMLSWMTGTDYQLAGFSGSSALVPSALLLLAVLYSCFVNL